MRGKLNFAIARSRGSIIQKLDDDDYYDPEFLSTTVSALSGTAARHAVVACSSCLVLISDTGELRHWEGLFAGGTLCFRKGLWQEEPFREVDLGVNQYFLADTSAHQVGIDYPEPYIYVRRSFGH